MRTNGFSSSLEHVAAVVRRCLERGDQVEIDGLGVFRPDGSQQFRFIPCNRARVFLAYVTEDGERAERLYDRLTEAGFQPWMDRRKLLPGQNWPRSIEEAIETSDFFLACFSTRSVNKKGGFQAEIRYALDCARRMPLDDIFLIPVRLDECRVPARIRREWQYIDLFPKWERGFRRLVQVLQRRADVLTRTQ